MRICPQITFVAGGGLADGSETNHRTERTVPGQLYPSHLTLAVVTICISGPPTPQ